MDDSLLVQGLTLIGPGRRRQQIESAADAAGAADLQPHVRVVVAELVGAREHRGHVEGRTLHRRRASCSGAGAGRAAGREEERVYSEALQSTFKILINSFYGYLGFGLGHFNDFDQANRVTSIGRGLIKGIVDWLEHRGCRIIEVDTDGLYFTLPSGTDADAEEQLLEDLAATLPEGIRLELAGRYRSMFSYKMKNYALLDEQEKLIIKGSGLRSRGLELFQRQWMEEMMLLLLRGEAEKIPELTDRYLKDFDAHRFPVRMFMKTETLQDSLETYQQKVKTKKRNPAAPYELALKSARPYQPGDQVSYYVSGQGTKVKVHEAAKLASQWDPKQPDENVEYYKAKLLDLYKKFRPFIEETALVPVDNGERPHEIQDAPEPSS